MKIYVDIDDTICASRDKSKYSEAEPIQANIDKINRLYDEGNYIIYWTARGTTSGVDYRDLTLGQLNGWGCKFHELLMGKRDYDLLICDKTKRIEEI